MRFRTARTAVLAALAGAVVLGALARQADGQGKAFTPFNGTDLKGWKLKKPAERSKWVVGRARLDPDNPRKFAVQVIAPGADGGPAARELVNKEERGVDIYTEEKFGDCEVELEFMVPQGSNSGIYVHGEYEIQILDSYGRKKVGPGDLGGLYGASAPRVNAAKKPGEWQKFVIEFKAPRFEGAKKVSNAKFLRVTLNGQVIHENVEMKGPTPSGVTGREAPTGPLMFQGDHGPVSFRNIQIRPKMYP
ncbi:MAG: DUF1080 domain-containing protein [Gemmataceae bacterium]|nr:DUF1080 domain-containing protein [Gemmataceae bacterium]